ncbi:hypothetical protein F4604DRAFT_1686092 [Suillus subluteus]|nr:hypothetical protein F4604DRAFT_1686092 [Suillus subluteus]
MPVLIADLDIFAVPAPAQDDEETAALKRQMQELRDKLEALVRSSPPEDDNDLLDDKKHWCERWTELRETQEDVQQQEVQEKEAEKDEEVEDAPGRRSIRVRRTQRSANRVESDPEVEIVETVPKQAMQMRKKQPLRMRGDRRTVNDKPCDRCASATVTRRCFSTDAGVACTDCKRLKVACSLVLDKGKPKPIAASTPTPAPKATLAGNARPAPGPKGNGEAGTKRTVSPARQNIPGPSTVTRPVVYIDNSSRKRKFVEKESDEEEDAYMAGRIHALPGLIGMVETALEGLKTEVDGIKSHMARKRRHV